MQFKLSQKYKLKLSHLIDHELLHKVGKQWVVISLSTLFLLTGASALNAHADPVMTTPVTHQSVKITQQANQMHRQLLHGANQRIVPLSRRLKSQSTSVKSHFRRTNRKHLLKRSGYGRVSGYTRHTVRNYYAPNDRRAYVPRNFKLINHTVWLKGSSYRIRKHPRSIKSYTYQKHGHKWLEKHGIHKVTRRHIRSHVNRHRTVKNRYRFHQKHLHHHRSTESRQYLLRDKDGMSPLITNDGMHKLQNSDVSDYSDDFSDVSNSDNPAIKIKDQAQLAGYNLDQIKGSDEGQTINGWVFSDELSHHHAGHYHGNDANTFKDAIERQFEQNHFTTDEQSRINGLKQKYNYLSQNENSSDINNIGAFRQHEIDWINFYRTNLYNLQPVSENPDYDEKAQNGAETNQDPEDMVDTTSPSGAIQSFFTDEDDGDGNDEAGHRDSILNPSANQVGVGAHSDTDTLFFDWGIANGAENGQPDSVAYPNAGLFPLSDATDALDGSCWSYQFASHPYEMGSENDNNSYTPDISIHDDTSDTDLNVTDVNPQPDEVYYHVNADALKDGHQYTVNISGLPNGNVNYSFKLFKLS